MWLYKRHIYIIVTVVLLTTFLTWFFYAHETLPKPIRAVTSLIEIPVAIASGFSHYLNLGVDVYETPWTIILTNLIFSVVLFILLDKLFIKRKEKNIQ